MITKEFSYGIIPLRKTPQGIETLLIAHTLGKHWSFPKGKKDSGETDLETALRELKEETGLEVEKILSDVPYMESYTFYKSQEKVLKTVSYYPAFVKGDLVLQAEEILDAKWVPIQDAVSYLTFKEAKAICLKIASLF